MVVFENVTALVAFAITRGLYNRANERKPDLTAVRVTRQQQRHALRYIRKDVGVVSQSDHRLPFRNFGDRLFDSLWPGPKIGETYQPQRNTAGFDLQYLVLENLDAVL